MPAFDERDTTANVSVVSEDRPVEMTFRRVVGQTYPDVIVTFETIVDGKPSRYSKRLTAAQAANGWSSGTTRTIKNHLLLLIDAVRGN